LGEVPRVGAVSHRKRQVVLVDQPRGVLLGVGGQCGDLRTDVCQCCALALERPDLGVAVGAPSAADEQDDTETS
jgi:hypothetical protein